MPSIFVEQNGLQTVMSINQIRGLDTFDIIDCRAIEAICALFEETKNVVSVFEIVKLVSGGLSIFEISHQALTNFKQYNKLHMWALREKEISKISVDFENRIIKLTFTKKCKKWVKFLIHSEYRYKRFDYINIPLATFNISGLQNEIGVRTIGGIYLDSKSQLCQYIQKIYNELKCDTEESRNLFRLFLEFIFGTGVLEYRFESKKASSIMQNTLHKLLMSSGYNKDLETLLWSKISKDEFSKTVLEESYSIFSTSNFDRIYKKNDVEF